jgi:amino acid adenylation domain-containing protein
MLTDAFVLRTQCQPHATAVGCCGIRISYRTLLGQASAVARLLDGCGISIGDRVAFVLPKTHDAIAVLLGTLLVGAAYVPFDPRQPPERLSRALGDCEAKVLVTTTQTLDRIHSVDAPLLCSYRAIITGAACQLGNSIVHDFSNVADGFLPAAAAKDSDPAYVLYTSGSTGEPKGVVHSHRSALRFVDWAIRTFRLNPEQRLANFAQLSFDLSILDVFGALCSGASVELVPPESMLRPKELVRNLGDWGTTLLYAVPSAISLLESEGGLQAHPPSSLARVLYAGEPFIVPQLVKARQALPSVRFFNLYGPTETNVCTHFALPDTLDVSSRQIPIGKPCDHLTVELLDERAKKTSEREEGEICVAGPSVMDGYFKQPDATSRAFFAGSNFADGQARYRTGDRAKLDLNGQFWFLGRRDRMVKRRGYRIELGEIEAALGQNPQIRESAVFSAPTREGVQIKAAVVLHRGHHASVLTLKAQCGKLLPPYMVPDTISVLTDLPRTPNGKVDLLRLGDLTAV